jgi:hypothetical protein
MDKLEIFSQRDSWHPNAGTPFPQDDVWVGGVPVAGHPDDTRVTPLSTPDFIAPPMSHRAEPRKPAAGGYGGAGSKEAAIAGLVGLAFVGAVKLTMHGLNVYRMRKIQRKLDELNRDAGGSDV